MKGCARDARPVARLGEPGPGRLGGRSVSAQTAAPSLGAARRAIRRAGHPGTHANGDVVQTFHVLLLSHRPSARAGHRRASGARWSRATASAPVPVGRLTGRARGFALRRARRPHPARQNHGAAGVDQCTQGMRRARTVELSAISSRTSVIVRSRCDSSGSGSSPRARARFGQGGDILVPRHARPVSSAPRGSGALPRPRWRPVARPARRARRRSAPALPRPRPGRRRPLPHGHAPRPRPGPRLGLHPGAILLGDLRAASRASRALRSRSAMSRSNSFTSLATISSEFHILLRLAAADSADDGHDRSCPAKTRRFEGDLWEKR
jgi:hypothetical protein